MSASEVKGFLSDLLQRRLDAERVRAHEESWSSELWEELAEMGMTAIDVPGQQGDAEEGTLEAALAVAELCGYHNANLPIVEAGIVGAWVRGAAGLPPATGVDGVVMTEGAHLRFGERHGNPTLSGELEVPWGSYADELLVVRDRGLHVEVLLIDPGQGEGVLRWSPARNLAGEPRDTVTLTDAVISERRDLSVSPLQIRARRALGKAAMMLGAMDRAIDLAIDQVTSREQFGRPLSKFQVIQHYMAGVVAEQTSARAGVDRAAWLGDVDVRSAAAAKVRAGMAASVVARTTHHVHGAIGVTQEHELGLSTRRLWSWRDEAGEERFWARVLGRELASSAYTDSLWAALEPLAAH